MLHRGRLHLLLRGCLLLRGRLHLLLWRLLYRRWLHLLLWRCLRLLGKGRWSLINRRGRGGVDDLGLRHFSTRWVLCLLAVVNYSDGRDFLCALNRRWGARLMKGLLHGRTTHAW